MEAEDQAAGRITKRYMFSFTCILELYHTMAGGNRGNIPGKFGLKGDKRSTDTIVVFKKIYWSATIIVLL